MAKNRHLPWIILILVVISCSMANDQADESVPPITVPWDFNAYETPQVVLWRLGPGIFRVAEVLNWRNKALWRSEGHGDVIWAFQDTTGHEIGEGFYRVKVEESGSVHWASMNVHWNQRIAHLDNDNRHAIILWSGPTLGTGFSATIANQDSTPWQLTSLSWQNGGTQSTSTPIEIGTADSTVRYSVVLLPYQANAYRVRFVTPVITYLDSIRFDIVTRPLGESTDSSSAGP